MTTKNVQGAPNLVIEVASESTAEIDRSTKLKPYLRYGIAEYWIIDPWKPSTEVYRRAQGSLELSTTIKAEGPLTTPLLPGFNISLSQLVKQQD